MGGLVPAIEIADHGYGRGIRCPDGEVNTVLTVAVGEVGAEFFGKPGMGAFLEEEDIVFAKRAGDDVLAVCLLRGGLDHSGLRNGLIVLVDECVSCVGKFHGQGWRMTIFALTGIKGEVR